MRTNKCVQGEYLLWGFLNIAGSPCSSTGLSFRGTSKGLWRYQRKPPTNNAITTALVTTPPATAPVFIESGDGDGGFEVSEELVEAELGGLFWGYFD